MTAILYELYRSDFIKEDSPITIALRLIFPILLLTQIIFLFMRGLLLANVSEAGQKKLLSLSDSIYASGFQLSIIFFIIGLFLSVIVIIFDSLMIRVTWWATALIVLINISIVVMAVYVWKKSFSKNNDGVTNFLVYLIVTGWTVFVIVVYFYAFYYQYLRH